MSPGETLVAFLILGSAFWLWYESMQGREVALKAARYACEKENLQLLDATVSLDGIRLNRDDEGRVNLLRRYRFEFSDTGDNRRLGEVRLQGRHVVGVELEPFRG